VSARLGLWIINALLLALLLSRLIVLKRSVDRYRPPSPLPRGKRRVDRLTIMRVS